MSDNALWPALRPHKIQGELYRCPARFVWVAAGRQSGKTEIAYRRIVRLLRVRKPWPRPKYFIMAPTLRQARLIGWDRVLELIPPHWIKDVNLTESRIKTKFGSELFFDGLDSPQRVCGQILDGGIIDESADVKPGSYAANVHGTLVTRRGWCWHIGVCRHQGQGAREFKDGFMKAASGETPDSAAFSWPSSSVLSAEELALARTTCDERTFDEQYNASWLDSIGNIFYSFSRTHNVRECIYDPGLPLIVGLDFNVDPLCGIIGQIKGTSLEIIDEIFLRNSNTVEALKMLVSRWGHHKSHFEIYGDASSRARHTSTYDTDYTLINDFPQLRALGRSLHFDRSNPPVVDRFQETNSRLQSADGERHVFISPKCKNLIRDLESRCYRDGTREANDSDPDSGHMTDSLGYAIHKLWPLRVIVPNPQRIIFF